MACRPQSSKRDHPRWGAASCLRPVARGIPELRLRWPEHRPVTRAEGWGSVSLSDGRPSQMDGLEIRLPANADQIPVARRAVADFCELYGLPAPLVEDVKLVITEACTNVVLHAYDGSRRTRMFEVRAHVEPGVLLLTVSDQGRGIGAPSMNRGLGLGLRLALQLAGGVQTREGAGGLGRGSTMRFASRSHGLESTPARCDRRCLASNRRPAALRQTRLRAAAGS